jgi:DNA (cytosine-5)-methyltransferase 1
VIYGSVCSGIEAASVAWHPLGWRAAFLSEIEPFPRAVLAHHYPDVPLHGDFTTIQQGDYAAIDVLVGGTPCQSFSVAGLRGGMADERGNLALEYLRLADRLRPRWLVWENVPGVLSSAGGRDFGAFLGGLGELRYGWAYRVLDAQYFGLAQRRKRVFVVGCAGDWRGAAAVLFERHSLSRHPAPRREARKGSARGVASGADWSVRNISQTITSNYGKQIDSSDTSLGPNVVMQPITFHPTQDPISSDEVCHSLGANANATAAVAIGSDNYNGRLTGDIATTLATQSGDGVSAGPSVLVGMQVRRLTPRECERLQGFPDDYTQVPHRGKPAADGPRYKALGNSMAVPCMAWIGQRIAAVDALQQEAA